MPDDVFEWLEERAKLEHRSISGQIRFIVCQLRDADGDKAEDAASTDLEGLS